MAAFTHNPYRTLGNVGTWGENREGRHFDNTSLILCVSSERFKDSVAIPLVISCLETIVKYGRSICAISKCLELDLSDNKFNFAV